MHVAASPNEVGMYTNGYGPPGIVDPVITAAGADVVGADEEGWGN